MVVDLEVGGKPRSLPSLIRFLRRVRRVSASSFGKLGRDQPRPFSPRRRDRGGLPPLTSLTFASRSSSACFALLIGVLAAFAALSSTLGVGAAWAPRPCVPLGRASSHQRLARCARTLALRRLTTLAFFFAARTFFSFFASGPSVPRR